MGLGAPKVKQRFGLDPRNTNWANDTSRFGHQHLEKLGWKPGKGLGVTNTSNTSHIKINLKDDNVGLGAKLARKRGKDGLDGGDSTGLDVFQRLLGRLNGREDEISDVLERQRKERIFEGKWGISFVKGPVLGSTWDSEKGEPTDEPSRKRVKVDSSVEETTKEKKREKKERKDEKKKEKKDKKDKKDKKVKKESKDKKSKKETKEKDKKEKNDKKDKKEKREKKEKKEKRQEMMEIDTASSTPTPVASRNSIRSRWIAQKRAAVADSKALNEIFMITN